MANQVVKPADDEVGAPKSARKRVKSTKMQPPMTPMIDVVFQLLIFFLVGCQFKGAEGLIPADLPQEGGVSESSELPLEPIKIYVRTSASRQKCDIQIEGIAKRPGSFKDLTGILVGLVQSQKYDKTTPIIIRPRANASWGHVVRTFNAVIASEMKNISFASGKTR